MKIAVAAIVALSCACTPSKARSAEKHDVGTNLAPVRDWSPERPFADLMKQSRAWISNTSETWDDGRPLAVDAHGWVRSLLPGQRARTLVMWGEPIEKGDYVVTWSGHGTLDFWPQDTPSSSSGRAVIHADPARGGLAVTVTALDAKDPVRDIHVVRSGDEGKEFSPRFLESLHGYSTLRFMDWMETNDAKAVHFSERPTVADARWSERGVPLEVMVDLCNQTKTDMWLTIPDTWDADAVARAAALVHQRLDPKRTLYVEHSNEVWNGMFQQAKRAQAAGLARGLSKNPFEAQLREHAQKSGEVFAAFAKVFAKDRYRLVRVLGSQAATPWASEVLLSEKGVSADAVAIAPYFGAGVRGGTVDEIMKQLGKSIDEQNELIQKHKRIAAHYGVRLLAYEGGQHLVGDNKAFIDANRDPRMRALYLRSLKGWSEGGGGLFLHYYDVGMPGKFGSWGAREHVDQPRAQAPKLDALMTFAENR